MTRRGLTPPAMLPGAAIAFQAPDVQVPEALAQDTVLACLSTVQGQASALASTTAVTLSRGVLQAMAFSKSTTLVVVMLSSVLALVLARAVATQQPSDSERDTAPSEPQRRNREDASIRSVAKLKAELREAAATNAQLRQEIQDLRMKMSKKDDRNPDGIGTPTAKQDGAPRSESSDKPAAQGQERSDPNQPTLRAGGYIFTASPTGNKAIAYNPISREVKSVQLNATKDQPLRITPMTGSHVQLVALRLEGPKITRVAAFDLKSDRWVPLDLAEPVSGGALPVYVGHSGTAYDLGRHVYTFSLPKGTWDHLDLQAIGEDVEGSASGKAIE